LECINECGNHSYFHINNTYIEKKTDIDEKFKELEKKNQFLINKAKDDGNKTIISDDKLNSLIRIIDKSKEDIKCRMFFQKYTNNKNPIFPAKSD